MMTNVKATYANGALVPLEPLDLEEGAEVTVSVEKNGPPANDDPPAKGGLAAVLKMAKEAQKSMPPDFWDGFPTDFSKNKKHYLYGFPKEEED